MAAATVRHPSGGASSASGGSSSNSDMESDREIPPRVHPTLHGFSCGFSQRLCGHDDLFHPHYTRTNLRKGDKILRCFPHCCPDHVARSFCGTSLHLDVQWEVVSSASSSSANPGSSSSISSSPPDVLVFARFRIDMARGLLAGDHVAMDTITQSLQSDHNPHGEWIPARVVSSTTTTTRHAWVFEINPTARWFYHWESGVAKRHRLKLHVLDVYVFTGSEFRPSSVSSSSSPSPSSAPLDVLQVVSSTCSPPFRLISFRRATPKAVLALATPAATTTTTTTEPLDARPVRRLHSTSTTTPSLTKPVASKRSSKKVATNANSFSVGSRITRVARPATATTPPVSPPPAPPPAPPPPHVASGGRLSFANLTASIRSASHHHQPQLHPPRLFHLPIVAPPLPPPPPPAAYTTAQRLSRLLRCLPLVRTADALPFMDTFHRVYVDALARAFSSSSSSSSSSFSSATFSTGPLRRRSSVDAVTELLLATNSLQDQHRPHHQMPRELLAILCELLLWLSFDVDLHAAMAATCVAHAQVVVVPQPQPQLHDTHATLLEWLTRHVDAFLQDRGWRLEDVVVAAVAADQTQTQTLMRDSGPQHAFAAGLRVLVAQLSEEYVRQTSRHGRGAVVAVEMAAVHRPLLRRTSTATTTATTTRYAINGDWYCAMLRGGLSVVSSFSSRGGGGEGAGSGEDDSLLSLFALLRELGAVSLQLHCGGHHPLTLHVTSLLHTANKSSSSSSPSSSRSSSATQLRLTQTNQWFRAFPSGISTAALPLGGRWWGDHVGRSATEEIHVSLYAWDDVSTTSSTTSDGASIGRCFQLTIQPPTADRPTLVVYVSSSSAVLDSHAAVSRYGLTTRHDVLRQVPFWSLAQRLSVVRAWEPLHSVVLEYTRIG